MMKNAASTRKNDRRESGSLRLSITILTGIIESIKADDLAAKLPKVGLMAK